MRSRMQIHGRTALRASVALLLALSAWSASAQAPEPVAHWAMDAIEEGVVADVSGNGRGATAHGAEETVPDVIPGIAENALHFHRDLQQYLLVENTEGLLAPDAMTVMAWIRPDQRRGAHGVIGNKSDKSGEPPWPGWRFRYFWARIVFQFGTEDGLEPQVATENWSVEPGFWHHVAVTYDGQRLRAFINCDLAAEAEVPGPIMRRDRHLVIGNFIGRKNAYAFDGGIDELKIFDHVLSPDEIFAAAVKGMPQ